MKKTIKVTFVGDICLEGVSDIMTPEYSKEYLKEVKPFFDNADIRIANLENTIGDKNPPILKCGPNLTQTREALCFVRELGIDCHVLANNHVGDYGPGGVEDTVNILKEEGLGYVGAGANIDEAYKPWYIEIDGCKVALCAFCENEFGGATLTEWGVAGFDLSRAFNAILEAKKNADYVIVTMHGGNEFNPLPSPGTQARYRSFIDMGADAVVGTHTHCMQGTEIYKGVPIIYSSGNFTFAPRMPAPYWYRGYLTELTFTKDAPAKFEIHPYSFTPELDVLHVMKGEERDRTMAYLKKLSDIIASEPELNKYYEGWCAYSGPEHAAFTFDKEFLKNPEKEVAHLDRAYRNVHTCEAHNEMITRFSRIVADGRLKEANEMVEKIKELQQMP